MRWPHRAAQSPLPVSLGAERDWIDRRGLQSGGENSDAAKAPLDALFFLFRFLAPTAGLPGHAARVPVFSFNCGRISRSTTTDFD